GGQWNRDDVVAGSPPEILQHLAIARTAERDDSRYVPRIVPDEDDITGLHRHVGARANRHGDIGREQCGRVVDAVANHRHALALSFQLRYLIDLITRQHLGDDAVDAEIRGHGVRHCYGVAGQHHDVNALVV